MNPWSLVDLPDQTGRIVVVTGATSGIGLVTARELMARGAYVILACRDVAKGEQLRAELGSTGQLSQVRRVDLADLDSVREFAVSLANWRIDILINNAGCFVPNLQHTPQGHELMFGTNVLGPFLLTQLLLQQGAITDRVVWLSSAAHRMGKIDLADPDWHRRRWSPWRAYATSKLGDLVLAYEQQRRFVTDGSLVRSVAAHPGWSSTKLFDPLAERRRGKMLSMLSGVPIVAQSAEDGALPSLYAAGVPELPGGTYVGPSGPGELTGWPRPVGSSAASHDRSTARRFWAMCEELTGLR
ncbi:hypothetical protein KEM60_00607 [Austwickia sp. TVS 96-490-7B]|uniref:oxidoreductase n=1 Tax=Austwickia sp. TVS 96-490-7B TaxID=2830843 RepID=UPI001C583DD6|nr:oxidoreductase [Austwickia sp. TVS 96-490-7B]MBW3084420.1 hypothetical protein [Austwickia sp. TVS 96-490-7B]